MNKKVRNLAHIAFLACSTLSLHAQQHVSAPAPNTRKADSNIGSPGGYAFIGSNCASGGYDYFLCENGKVMGIWEGAEQRPLIQMGDWSLKGDQLTVTLHTVYSGEGEGDPAYMSNVADYSMYKAQKSAMSDKMTYTWNDDILVEDGCEEVRQSTVHHCGDIQAHLWQSGVKSKFMVASQRLLTESELQKYSKEDLRIMRNEIFARYGYIFKTKDMQAYFEAQGHSGNMSDVTAFLSDIETKNIETIKKVEGMK